MRGWKATTAALALTLACSGPADHRDDGGHDAGTDAGPPNDGQPAAGDCVQRQRDYVDSAIAVDQQADPAVTIAAVLGATSFPASMPYCSGDRPPQR